MSEALVSRPILYNSMAVRACGAIDDGSRARGPNPAACSEPCSLVEGLGRWLSGDCASLKVSSVAAHFSLSTAPLL
jgi:hypothetical protein